MRGTFIKWLIVILVLVLITSGGLFYFVSKYRAVKPVPAPVVEEKTGPAYNIIGRSVEGRIIDSYTFGNGDKVIGFVGGVHGGYEWNSVLLAYTMIDYFSANPKLIPENLKVVIIPNANPDGVFKVVGKEGRFTVADVKNEDQPNGLGRFNANGVDLNRNFDCKWQPQSMWKAKTVSAGSAAFSEPESQAVRDFVLKNKPAAMIFWHSQANAVYASECKGGILPETTNIMKAYSAAAGYKAIDTFDAYAVTGDAEGWLASIGIPAITIELSTHQTIEWDKNLAGVKALFQYYNKLTK